MGKQHAYTAKQFVAAVSLTAVIGWAAVTTLLVIAESSSSALWPYILVGFPTAFIVTWLFIGPILWVMMRKPIGWVKAAGAGVTAALAGSTAVLGLVFPEGWEFVVEVGVVACLLGGLIAVLVRAVMGPGNDTARH